jgi:uncharacterized protein
MSELHPLFDYDGHMNTVSGIKFNIFDPKPEMISIEDICNGLSFKGHFCGQSPKFFSIAQHSLLVESRLPDTWKQNIPEISLVALLHDAPEAYIGDMIKPIKIHFPLFSEIEDKIMKAISVAFVFDLSYMSMIKRYDKEAQKIEYNTFYAKTCNMDYLTPEQSRRAFMKRFNEIWQRL